MKRKKFDIILDAVAEFFKIIAHPDRIRLIGLLHHQEMDVSQLHEAMGISQSAVSNHLKLLKLHRLVASRQEGKHHYYRLTSPLVSEVIVSPIELHVKDLVQEKEVLNLLKEMKQLLKTG